MEEAHPSWDEYEKVENLGRGSFGTVYKVRNKNTNKYYVIKEVDTTAMTTQQSFDAFEEISVQATIDSPYVVTYHDSFIEGNSINIVMEYCKHGDLCNYLIKLKEYVSENVAWKFFIQICLGIYSLHSKNVLHRDLKTLNIFLTMDNSVRIGDLGVATVLNPNGGFLVKKVGTPYYLSPEVCEDKPYNHKCDIWSLGCILYEICALKHPFEAKTQAELMVKIIKGKYKRIPKKFSRHLSDMVHWLLTKNCNRRPSIKEIILHPFFQKKAVQLRIALPLRPKEVLVPGRGLKVTGGAFDNEDFKMTSDSKLDNSKRTIRGSDLTKKYNNVKSKVNNLPPKTRSEIQDIKSTHASSPEGPFKLSDEKKEIKLSKVKSRKNLNESKEEEPKIVSSKTKPARAIRSTINDVFVSGIVQKEKQEMRKIALQKRKQYGKMIQKQVLRMYKKKNQDDDSGQKQRFSQCSKSSQKTPEDVLKKKREVNDSKEFVKPARNNKRSVSVYNHPVRFEKYGGNLKSSKDFEGKSRPNVEIITPKSNTRFRDRSSRSNIRSGLNARKSKNISKTKEELKSDRKQTSQKKRRNDIYSRNKLPERRNTTAANLNIKQGQMLLKGKVKSGKQGTRLDKNRPRSTNFGPKRLKPSKMKENKKNSTPSEVEQRHDPYSTVTATESKNFFDEVIDDAGDLDMMLHELPNIEEEGDHLDDPEEDEEFEIRKELQAMKAKELRIDLKTESKIINQSDDEEGLCEVGDETPNGFHNSIPKASMKTRTIGDITTKNNPKRMLSPIRENDCLNDSHEYVYKNNIKINSDDKFLAKSYQNEKDWQKLQELEKNQQNEESSCVVKLKSRNQTKITSKTFKMKSHILLPSKLLSRKEEQKKENIRLSEGVNTRETQKPEKGDFTPPFEISKERSDNSLEFSKAIEDFNKDLIENEQENENNGFDQNIRFLTESDLSVDRRDIKHSMNSLIEEDDLLLDTDIYRARNRSNYSIGDDLRHSHERSEVSDTTKNINASFDGDQTNRREEIEASIESLELKAISLLNDENKLKLCEKKMKEFFEKCMEDEGTSDEELKMYIQDIMKPNESQTPAVGDLTSFEKINELINILSKIQYQQHELSNF
ncbi:unnamed protein product [Moneuplotes crassus]|uniref:non-specific serine/threonine protein kinase n=1 Tax=Euplotes crassus TaxID=5936 RepID=A0AAD1XD17_EUPCR|nr:unnamed protein product [Moneuplotes crassus]